MTDSQLKVQLLLTGNEIMSGYTVASNSALIAAADLIVVNGGPGCCKTAVVRCWSHGRPRRDCA